MGDKMDFAGKNPFTDSPLNSSLPGVVTFSSGDNFIEPSKFFQTEDFGKESLGIIDPNNPDFRRDSLALWRDSPICQLLAGNEFPQSEDFGKESLGILDPSTVRLCRDSIDFLRDDSGRESLGILNLNNLDIGRESLGITNIKTYDFVVPNGLPEIQTSACDTPELTKRSPTFDSVFNNAFLNVPKCSVSSSVSSRNPSFHSASLESLPSRIFSSTSSKTDVMNEPFKDTADFFNKLFNKTPSPLRLPSHRRNNSLPVTLESKINEYENYEKVTHNKSENVCEKAEEKGNDVEELDDSVFLEKILTMSRAELDVDNYMLDSIQEPEEMVRVIDDLEEPVKCDKETVFKTVDKMFLSAPNCENLNTSRASNRSNNSKSREALDMISTLSDILSTDKPSEKQKCEGQNLLTSLAEILLSSASTRSRSCALEDSGNSSIESEAVPVLETAECYEVLDLRKKSSSESDLNRKESFENCAPLDLSMKSKSSLGKTFESPKILPPKFKNQKSVVAFSVNKSAGSNYSNSSNDSKNLSDPTKKFRPKKADEKVVKRGPLRAVLPVDNMARKSGPLKVTPTRPESKTLKYKLKKTSTPINESNLKPMAQSTPEGQSSSRHVMSPLARPEKSLPKSPTLVKQKLNYSGTGLPVKNETKIKSNSFTRRVSSDNLKRNQNTERPLVRSYSVGEKTGLPRKTAELKKPIKRQSLPGKTDNVLKENNIRSVNRLSVGKKSGKENLY
ncbi:uncharacterized protein LOC100142621 isoform X2 [Tribolium castaneum]|uniref:uncharacterized protein LOC100142621 isoform X2 n=1 Tax=Tribolium castaneum TaxID=7070 RepID=UPI0030FE50FF